MPLANRGNASVARRRNVVLSIDRRPPPARPRVIVKQAPRVQIQPSKASRRFRVPDLTQQLLDIFTDPYTLLITFVGFAIVADFTNNPSDNIITQFANAIGKDTPIGKYLLNHAVKFIGMLLVLPGAFCAPRNIRIATVIAILLAVYLFHPLSYIAYFGLGLLLRLLFRARDPQLRLLLGLGLAIAIAIYAVQVSNSAGGGGSGSNSTSPTTTTAAPRSATSAPLVDIGAGVRVGR